VAKEDRTHAPAHSVEEERWCVPRGHQGGGSEGQKGLDEDSDKEKNNYHGIKIKEPFVPFGPHFAVCTVKLYHSHTRRVKISFVTI